MRPSPDDPWRASWESLHGRAWWYLNHSAELPPSVSGGRPFHDIPRLRLWDDAMGFQCGAEPTTFTVYELFADDHHREPVVRKAVWQRTADLSRAHQESTQSGRPVTFKPTFAVRDAPVPAEQFASLLEEAVGFRVPVVWFSDAESVTSDVGNQGFEFFGRDQPAAALKLEWSSVTPPDWDPVIRWYRRLRQFLERCL
jgi:hypothetical protein